MPRPGFITPSTFADLMSNGRGKDTIGKSALAIIDQLTLGLLGVEQQDTGTNRACDWGNEHEWQAVQLYEERTMRSVRASDFTVSPDLTYVGGTMDGLIGEVGGIEVKSPYNSLNHFANLTTGEQLHKLYWYQVQGYLWIFELEWIDFVSYDPRYPEKHQLYIERVVPDGVTIDAIKKRCEMAYKMANEKLEVLSQKVE